MSLRVLTRMCEHAHNSYFNHPISDTTTVERKHMFARVYAPYARTIEMSIRGSDDAWDWIHNLCRWRHQTVHGGIHYGFYQSALLLDPLLPKLNDKHIVRLSGHSMGGSVALILGVFLAFRYPTTTIQVFTFGSPPVGDHVFAKTCSTCPNLSVTRLTSVYDVAPYLPYFKYVHVGKHIVLPAPTPSYWQWLFVKHNHSACTYRATLFKYRGQTSESVLTCRD